MGALYNVAIPRQAMNALTRRDVLGGLAGILAAACSPAILPRRSPLASGLADEVGQLLISGLPDRQLRPAARVLLARGVIGGVVLFRRNLSSLAATLAYVRGIHDAARSGGRRALVAVDQEGGSCQVIAGKLASRWPSAQILGRHPPATVQLAGRRMGLELAGLTVDLDLAPVLDVGDPQLAGPLGDRIFADDPAGVASAAGAFAAGLRASGILATGKHFPGLGGLRVDSHRALPVSTRSVAELEARELVPFRRLAPRLPLMMVSHGAFPSLARAAGGDGAPRPASLDPHLVEGWLRERLGFVGVVISDDLGMGAVGLPPGPAALAALDAGCDLLLFCHQPGAALVAREHLIATARRDTGVRTRIHQALARLRALPAVAAGLRKEAHGFQAFADSLDSPPARR
jgi:beta-N-acetylhexosaminidase